MESNPNEIQLELIPSQDKRKAVLVVSSAHPIGAKALSQTLVYFALQMADANGFKLNDVLAEFSIVPKSPLHLP